MPSIARFHDGHLVHVVRWFEYDTTREGAVWHSWCGARGITRAGHAMEFNPSLDWPACPDCQRAADNLAAELRRYPTRGAT